MRPLVFLLISVTAAFGQTSFVLPPQVIAGKVQCDPANFQPIPIKKDCKQKTITLHEAITFVVSALNQAQCAAGGEPARFKLTTADIDLQTLTDLDGTLEVLFIGGLAGELDKSTTSDTDFTYSVPTPLNPPANRANFLSAQNKPKQNSSANLAGLILQAMDQLQQNVAAFPTLSQHQVKVSLKFAFTKDFTIEAEPKLGSVGITAKLKKTSTATQTLTLTFADQVPIITLNVSPSPATAGEKVTLLATALPPVNSGDPVVGKMKFMDGMKEIATEDITNGVASTTSTSLSAGAHTIWAIFAGEGLDPVSSSASILIINPTP